MAELDLSVPGGPPPRRRASFLQVLTLLFTVAVLGLLVVDRWDASGPTGPVDSGQAEHLERLAMDLEKRQVYEAAAGVWNEYLETADLSPEERAEAIYLRGTCLKRAGRYAEAARCLTEVELLPLSRERKRKAQQMLLDCLSSLGLHDAREYVSGLFATGVEPEEGLVLARVDGREITKEQLRERLESEARKILALQGAPMTPAELEESAAKFAESRLSTREGLEAALSQTVSSRLLYLEGLERGFGDDPETLRELSQIREQVVGQRVVEEELSRAMESLGPTELSNHYEAHKEEFVEKAGSEFSWASFSTEAEARAALEKLGDPATAAEVPLEKASGPAVAGEPLPDIPTSAEITAHLLALEEGEVSDRPIENAGAYYIFRVERRRPRRQLSLSEAESEVRASLAEQKQAEAQEALSALLQRKYEVEIVSGALAKEPAPAEAGTAPPAEDSARSEDGNEADGGADDETP